MSKAATTVSQLSELYDAFSAPRRCYTLQALAASQSNLVEVSNLGNQITAIEQDISPTQASGDPYQNVYNALNQSHLPVLDEVGIVKYDSDRKTVAPGPMFEEALLLLNLTQLTYEHLE
jgi:hypothetical protein